MTFRPLRMVRPLPRSSLGMFSTSRNDLSAVTDGETPAPAQEQKAERTSQ